MDKRMIVSNISIYGVAHALVDATCAALILSLAASAVEGALSLVVMYNVLAFALQSPFGLMADRFRIPVPTAIVGLLLVAASTLFFGVPFLAAAVAGIGNALFHVGGGVISLNLVPGKATMPGIYVAPGALGLLIGGLVGRSGQFVAWPFILLLAGAVLLVWRIPRPAIRYDAVLDGQFKWFEAVILLLLFSIAIRGLVGSSLVLPWKSNRLLLVLLTLAVVLGKALGGVLGDRFGWKRVALAGLVVATPLLSFFADYPALAIAGAFCFNLTMPVTLAAMANMLPGWAGFAFGLTTLALILGVLPTFTEFEAITSARPVILSAIVVAIVVLYGGLRLYAGQFRIRPGGSSNQTKVGL
jgi:FSR family fosmidomycin resistance protein-like MFS transporter